MPQVLDENVVRWRRFLAQKSIDVWYDPQRPKTTLESRDAVRGHAVQHIGAATPVTYLEFGVAMGHSMRRFATEFTSPESRFVGFDSFFGLPEAWGNAAPGHFSQNGRTPAVKDSRISFQAGWFQNTLPDFLKSFETSNTLFVHFDADLYSSTLFLLSAFWWRVPTYYFLFDEFFPDELNALKDFASAYPVEIEFIADFAGAERRAHVVFGRLSRTQYEPIPTA